MWSRLTRQLIDAACEEDLNVHGDITTALLPDATADLRASVVAHEPGIICGLDLGPTVCEIFARRLNLPLEFAPSQASGRPWADGDAIATDTVVATVRGSQAAVLSVERTLLNFLGRMSGVATLTRAYVDAARAANPDVKILDTRKTLPGWRELDKYAVICGGGKNHRIGLFDAVLLKDNHLAGIPTAQLATQLTKLLKGALFTAAAEGDDENDPSTGASANPAFVEVEVDTLEQLEQACQVPGVDIILLDNFSLDQLRTAVQLRDAQSLRGKVQLEASGGITLKTVADIAATGVDRISVGALTHSARALNLGLDA